MGVSGNAAIAVEWAALAFTVPFVGLRVYARTRHSLLSVSDLVVVTTWLMFLANNICDNELWNKGLYQENLSWRDEWSEAIPDPETRVLLMKISYASYFPYILELWGVKFSLIALYYTLITVHLPKLRLALHLVTLYTIVTLIASIFLNLLWCIPISENWSLDQTDGNTCFSSIIPYVVPIAFHITSDFALYILPFILLKSLRMNLRRGQLAGILGLFGLGAICIGVSIGRFVASGEEVKIPTLAVWTALEMAIGLIVVCCPALKIFFTKEREASIKIHAGHASADSGKDVDTIKSWFSVRSRSASKTGDNMFRGSVDHSDLEMDSHHYQDRDKRTRQASHPRGLPRISQSSREGLVNDHEISSITPATPPQAAGRKQSHDRPYPPSEFKVEECLRMTNGNVQESVMALTDDILRSISMAYDEQSYNHQAHTHVQPRKASRDGSGWR
ncbi:hypothetical protein ABW19_dt0209906 [Dactylella cylindrospora]|nr:hypothetical protein ABW19_dt0209906 [Dactylella cylindrospora]